MYLQKKKRKNINIVNKPQQWVDFKFDTNTIKKDNNPIISGYDQIKNTHRFNEILLNAAYKNKAAGNWSAVSGRKVAVAGTQTLRDKYDDVTKIPFWGDLRKSERYEQLNKKLLDYPDVDSLVGHSLGSSVILEKQIQNPGKFQTTTYNAPVLQMSSMPQGDRYRSSFDPVSMFDKGAKTFDNGSLFNPGYSHDYTGNPKNTYASNTILPNGNQILIE